MQAAPGEISFDKEGVDSLFPNRYHIPREKLTRKAGAFMEFWTFITSNPLINVSVVSWVSAQLIKTLIDTIRHRSFDRHRLAGAGGMPSSHSAVTCSLLLTALFRYGFDSPIFAISFALALIVMYDATGVRWAAGLHAKAINEIVEYLEEDETPDKNRLREMIPKLNESLGHRVIEVICGAALGLVVACLFQFLGTPG